MKPKLINEPDAKEGYRKPPEQIEKAAPEVVDFVALCQKAAEDAEAALLKLQGERDNAPPTKALAPIDLSGLEDITEDLQRQVIKDPDTWLRVETINFRADSGYSTNMEERAGAAVLRAFNGDFGPVVKGVRQSYACLPAFAPANRLVVAIGIVRGD